MGSDGMVMAPEPGTGHVYWVIITNGVTVGHFKLRQNLSETKEYIEEFKRGTGELCCKIRLEVTLSEK